MSLRDRAPKTNHRGRAVRRRRRQHRCLRWQVLRGLKTSEVDSWRLRDAVDRLLRRTDYTPIEGHDTLADLRRWYQLLDYAYGIQRGRLSRRTRQARQTAMMVPHCLLESSEVPT